MDQKRECRSCANCGMDMDLNPYCGAEEIKAEYPYGRALYTGTPPECLKDGVLTLWKQHPLRKPEAVPA